MLGLGSARETQPTGKENHRATEFCKERPAITHPAEFAHVTEVKHEAQNVF